MKPFKLIESFVGGQENLYKLMRDFHEQGMSCQMISEMLERSYQVRVSRQSVWEFKNKLKLITSHSESMALRVVNERMDYDKRALKLDYKNRRKHALKKIKTNIWVLHRSLPAKEIEILEQWAKTNHVTKSEAYKILHKPEHMDATYLLQSSEQLAKYYKSRSYQGH